MAANALPLLALAATAFFLASKSKGGSGAAQSAAQNPGANAPFLVLTNDCQPIAMPTDEAEQKRQAEAIRIYIGRRAVELYQQLNAGVVPVRMRINTGVLTDEQKQYVKDSEVELGPIEIKDGYLLVPADDPSDLYAAIYDEVVPVACAQKAVWNAQTGEFSTIYPSPAAACLGAVIQVQANEVLTAVAPAEVPALSVVEIAETMLACIGLNIDLG